mmetsp:Transcript_59749/g.146623  ORF Transcript_59749/g.146623 Transcript_59749/m.146623 type:complete len:230 (-) Transcript_59749:5747-6436(-)
MNQSLSYPRHKIASKTYSQMNLFSVQLPTILRRENFHRRPRTKKYQMKMKMTCLSLSAKFQMRKKKICLAQLAREANILGLWKLQSQDQKVQDHLEARYRIPWQSQERYRQKLLCHALLILLVVLSTPSAIMEVRFCSPLIRKLLTLSVVLSTPSAIMEAKFLSLLMTKTESVMRLRQDIAVSGRQMKKTPMNQLALAPTVVIWKINQKDYTRMTWAPKLITAEYKTRV